MTHYYYPPLPYARQNAADSRSMELRQLAEAAKTGAIIGGTGAAALQLRQMQQQRIGWQQAARGTLKGAAQVSLAATAATAVGNLFNNKALSLAATLATGTAVMYALNKECEETCDE